MLRTAALGDFLLSLPAIAAVRRSFPRAEILLLTSSTTDQQNRARVEKYTDGKFPWVSFVRPQLVDRVLTWSGMSAAVMFSQLRPEILRFCPEATFMLCDVGAPVAGVVKKLAFLRVLGVRGAVFGWRANASRATLFLGQQARIRFEHHVMGPLRSVAEHPGICIKTDPPVEFPIAVTEEAEQWAKALLAERSGAGRVIAIAPGSIQPHKRWPEASFASLCGKLLALDGGITLLIIGTKGDAALGDALARDLGGRVMNLAGKSTIEQSAALLRRCALLVGNDGGAMHLGASVGCRSVSIIPGIELPGSVEPWGNENLAVRQPIACAPCYSFTHCPRGHQKCMTEIPVQRVLEKCLEGLGKSNVMRTE